MTRLPYEFKVWVPTARTGGAKEQVEAMTRVAGGSSVSITSGCWWSGALNMMVHDPVHVHTWYVQNPELSTSMHRDVHELAKLLLCAGEEAVLIGLYGVQYLLTMEDFKEKESKWSATIRKLFGQR